MTRGSIAARWCLLLLVAFLVAAKSSHTIGSTMAYTTVYGPVSSSGGVTMSDLAVTATSGTGLLKLCYADGTSETKTLPYHSQPPKAVKELKVRNTGGSGTSVKVDVDVDVANASAETESTWATTDVRGATLYRREGAAIEVYFVVSVDAPDTATVQAWDGSTLVEEWTIDSDSDLHTAETLSVLKVLPDSGVGDFVYSTESP